MQASTHSAATITLPMTKLEAQQIVSRIEAFSTIAARANRVRNRVLENRCHAYVLLLQEHLKVSRGN